MRILGTCLFVVLFLGVLVTLSHFGGGQTGAQAQSMAVTASLERHQRIPYYGIRINDDISYVIEDKMYYNMVSGIGMSDYRNLLKVVDLMNYFQIKTLVMTINSPGGDMFAGLSIAQLLREQIQNNGVTVSVTVYGLAASAAVPVLVSASKGQRRIAENSFIMIHEISDFTYMASESTDDKMKQARLMIMLQANGTAFLSRMTGMSVEDIAELRKAETWWSPEEAVANGFADKVIVLK